MKMNKRIAGPWPDVATARSFLGSLVALESLSSQEAVDLLGQLECAALADWLIVEGLSPLAYARYRATWPDLTERLREDMFSAAAEIELNKRQLALIAPALVERGLRPVALKGMALALSVYPEETQRTMSDIDLMLPEGEMEAAGQVMVALGYRQHESVDRPLALQEMAGGEIQFYNRQRRLVELHWSPFAGWWVKRTTAIDDKAIWRRIAPLSPSLAQLDPEDTVIHLAVHLAVNHHFCAAAIRGFIDIAFAAQKRPVDWEIVVERAKKWRVATAVYAALDMADQLVGIPGIDVALRRLRPWAARRWLIGRLVTPAGVLARRDLAAERYRYLLLLLLTDRLWDILWLVWRTVWPEHDWLAARYGQPQTSRWQHLGYMLRYRRI
jgi:hypothetical protein